MAPVILTRAAEIDLSGRRLLLVEEALRDYVGHWFEYVKSVVEINEGAGVEVTVAAHRQVDKELPPLAFTPAACSPKPIGTASITSHKPGAVMSGSPSIIGGSIAQCRGFLKRPGLTIVFSFRQS